MHLYYRISDNSYDKEKLIGATKDVCLMNFVNVFHEVIFGSAETPAMTIIADKCSESTLSKLNKTGIPVVVTEFGNAGSLRYALELAIEKCDENDLVYFCEDDYLHLGCAPTLLEEGIKRADYVTLYDHPDKYTAYYNGGEFSKVIKTTSSHWRYTVSTCMTFGTKVKNLKEDLDVWKKYTDAAHPHDHDIFLELGKIKKRRLAVCIPGVACHTDYEFSKMTKRLHMENWAIELMIRQLEGELKASNCEYTLHNKFGMEKLTALDEIRRKK